MFILKSKNWAHSNQKMLNGKLLWNVFSTFDEMSWRPTENRRRVNIFLDLSQSIIGEKFEFSHDFYSHAHINWQVKCPQRNWILYVRVYVGLCMLFSLWHLKYQWTKLSNNRNWRLSHNIRNEPKAYRRTKGFLHAQFKRIRKMLRSEFDSLLQQINSSFLFQHFSLT